ARLGGIDGEIRAELAIEIRDARRVAGQHAVRGDFTGRNLLRGLANRQPLGGHESPPAPGIIAGTRNRSPSRAGAPSSASLAASDSAGSSERRRRSIGTACVI